MKPLGNKLLLLLLVASAIVSLVLSSSSDEDDNDLDFERVREDDDEEAREDHDETDETQIVPPITPPPTREPGRPFLGVPGCGRTAKKSRSQARIVMGYEAAYGEFPSYVRLNSGNVTYRGTCGGTLISDRHVLTAMHCVAGLLTGHRLDLIFGDLTRGHKDAYEVTIPASRVQCTSPHYFRTDGREHDWVLIELKHRVITNEYIQPACLPRSQREQNPRTVGDLSRCYLVGMGVSGFKNFVEPASETGIPAMRLEKLRVEQADCSPRFKIYSNDSSRVCYKRDDGRTGGNSCYGDSGGPVLCEDRDGKWTLVAIVNGGRYPYCGINPDWINYTTRAVYANVIKLLPEMDYHCYDVLVSTKTPALPKKKPTVNPHDELRSSWG